MGPLNLTSGLFFPFAFELLKVTWFNPGLRAECRYSLLPQAGSINYKWSSGHFEMLHLLATAAMVVAAAAAAAKCSDSPGQSDSIYSQIEGLRCWQGHSELKVMTSPPLKGWRLFITWQPRPLRRRSAHTYFINTYRPAELPQVGWVRTRSIRELVHWTLRGTSSGQMERYAASHLETTGQSRCVHLDGRVLKPNASFTTEEEVTLGSSYVSVSKWGFSVALPICCEAD